MNNTLFTLIFMKTPFSPIGPLFSKLYETKPPPINNLSNDSILLELKYHTKMNIYGHHIVNSITPYTTAKMCNHIKSETKFEGRGMIPKYFLQQAT